MAPVVQHLSREEHVRMCREAHAEGKHLIQHVQVNYSGAPVCAVIRNAVVIDDRDFWKVEMLDPIKGIRTFPSHMVRKCSGVDGRCLCANEIKEN
jgi:hypothetical protein